MRIKRKGRKYSDDKDPNPQFSTAIFRVSERKSYIKALKFGLRGMEMDTTLVSSPGASNMRPCNSKATSSTDRDKTIAQYNADARILADFEKSTESCESFNYSRSVLQSFQSVPEEQITAYLSIIQRGGLIQPFGCMIAVEETSLKIIGYSENCSDLLGLKSQLELKQAKSLIGIDVRTLFTPSSSTSLANAAASREISFLNPIWVYSKTSQNPFYAILHRIDVGIVIDLEPAKSGDPALSLAGAVQSQKLAVRAISRLQSLPGGDIGALCDTVVEDVQKLTGYDRVMAYKFHDDDHGEVVSELRRSDLEPYLGLHYPSTDIPQAARFLFKQNRIRMICDCHAKPIKIIQSEKLKQSLCLVNSTLRSPYGCHAQYMINMGSIASLTMAVLVSSNNGTKLWGLVVCHHTSPRYLPFPLRYACELLMQAFGMQLYMEFQLQSQLMEKNILKTQTLISDMLLRDGPCSLVTQSPSIMDLIKCDGAALYYNGTCWLLGVTPSESQVMDIADWLLNDHQDSTGLSTDTLVDSGCPGAASLGDAVCGMVAARINSKDFLFWFRSHAAKEVKWAGAKHHPEDKDDGGKLHPRSSFNAFLEVVKYRSFPWTVSEINAIHTLQLIMRDSLQNFKDTSTKGLITAQLSGSEMQRVDELSSATSEMLRLIETATVPIFGVDSSGLINRWNAKISELTGLDSSNAMGKSLVGEVTHEDSRQTVESVLGCALKGEEERDVELKLRSFTSDRRESALYIVVNSCTSRDSKNQVIGVCFVGQDITSEKIVMDKFIQLQGDYKAIIHSLNPFFPPIFASDVNACCSEWNAAMEKLSGWKRDEVIGKILPGEVFGTFCQLKGQDTLTKFMISLYRSILGQETEELPFGFFNRKGIFVKVLLTANKRTDGAGDIIGCFCFLQIAEHVAEEHGEEEAESFLQLTELAYIRQEISNPLNGIRFIHKLLENSCIEENQKLFLNTYQACERQIMMIMEDKNLRTIEGGSIELNVEEFLLRDVFDATIGQIMILVRKKQLQLRQKIRKDIESLILYGDQIKLQLVLSDFLLNVVNYAPSPGGWVEINISSRSISIEDGQKKIHLQVRMTHPGEGLPSTLVQEMFGEGEQCTSHEGLGLNLSRELLSKMNGNVHYVREHNKCYFLVDLELQMKRDIPEELKAETIDRIIPS